MPELRITNYNMAAARLIAATFFTPLLLIGGVLLVAYGMTEAESSERLASIGGGLFFLLGAVVFGVMATTAVLSVTFGDGVTIRTLRGRKLYAWDEVKQLGIASQGTAVEVVPLVNIPVARHVVLYVLLTGDEVWGPQLKTNPEELSALAELLATQGRSELLGPLVAGGSLSASQ